MGISQDGALVIYGKSARGSPINLGVNLMYGKRRVVMILLCNLGYCLYASSISNTTAFSLFLFDVQMISCKDLDEGKKEEKKPSKTPDEGFN